MLSCWKCRTRQEMKLEREEEIISMERKMKRQERNSSKGEEGGKEPRIELQGRCTTEPKEEGKTGLGRTVPRKPRQIRISPKKRWLTLSSVMKVKQDKGYEHLICLDKTDLRYFNSETLFLEGNLATGIWYHLNVWIL